MDLVNTEKFEKAKELSPVLTEEAKIEEISDERLRELLEQMENPVIAQKEIAVQIKRFLDHRIDFEMKKNGILSDSTRRWVEQFNKVLDSIQKALHGDKSVNLHLHQVTHGQIAAKIRDAKGTDDGP